MRSYKILISIVYLFAMSYLFSSCEKDEQIAISAKLTETTLDVLQGDSLYLTVEIEGGTPPFAFRYAYDYYDVNVEKVRTRHKNVIGITERNYTFAEYINDTVTYIAESVASYYENVGPAVGSATFNVIPVEYVYEESVSATKTGYIQKSVGKIDFTKSSLLFRNTSNRTGSYTRIVYFEFDAAQIQKVLEKNRYILKFWLVGSHSSGVNVSSMTQVTGILGELSDDMTWDTQPGDADLTSLFSTSFKTTSTSEQIEFSGKIDEIVYKALENPGSKKFIIRVLENLNEVGSNGYYYIGGNLYSDETKRPVFEVSSRQIKSTE